MVGETAIPMACRACAKSIAPYDGHMMVMRYRVGDSGVDHFCSGACVRAYMAPEQERQRSAEAPNPFDALTTRGRCAQLLRMSGWIDSDGDFEEKVEALFCVLEGRRRERATPHKDSFLAGWNAALDFGEEDEPMGLDFEEAWAAHSSGDPEKGAKSQ